MKDTKEFHQQNLVMNKHHYTYMARMTQLKVVNAIQSYSAKMHFNLVETDCSKLEVESNGQ